MTDFKADDFLKITRPRGNALPRARTLSLFLPSGVEAFRVSNIDLIPR